jgi:hypothetical protein
MAGTARRLQAGKHGATNNQTIHGDEIVDARWRWACESMQIDPICYALGLPPQEKTQEEEAQEFMLFEFSSYVISDAVSPSTTGPTPQ